MNTDEHRSEEKPTIYVGGFSGGIDSQAAALYMRNHFGAENVVLCNSTAGENEHPMTVDFVRKYSSTVHTVHHTNPTLADLGGTGMKKRIEMGHDKLPPETPLTFDLLALYKGIFPSRTRQFCTEFLKLRPMKRFAAEKLQDFHCVRFSGLRRSESQKRKNTPFKCWDDYFGCEVMHPLADWSKKMCFEYVTAHGEDFNELYTLGFSRIGCAPCVNANKADLLAWAQRFPEMIDKVRAWEEQNGTTFFAPIVPGMRINWIDDVVRWAKTRRGGKQFDLLVLQERPACESQYGLCE